MCVFFLFSYFLYSLFEITACLSNIEHRAFATLAFLDGQSVVDIIGLLFLITTTSENNTSEKAL